MSKAHIIFDSLRALETVEWIIIRPYARMNEFVGYLVYTLGSASDHELGQQNPILYNIEVNEKTTQLRIRDETRETKFTCTGSLLEPQKELLVWYEGNNVIGSVFKNYVQETTETGQNKKIFYFPFRKAGNVDFKFFYQRECLGRIYGKENASYVGVGVKKLATVEKLMLMITGLKLLYCQYQFHQHPLPTNILHTREGLIHPTKSTLETLSSAIMRIAFNGMGNIVFAEILNMVTHKVELVVKYVFSPTRELVKYFMDIFGNLMFMSNCLGGKSPTETVKRSDGRRIGYITMGKRTEFFESSTGRPTMGKTIVDRPSFYPDSPTKISKIFATGRSNDVTCEFYDDNAQGNIHIHFLQAVSVEKKAMIFSHIAFLAIFYYKNISHFLKPAVQRYPMQEERMP